MAGIGFALRTLSHRDTISSIVAAVGHAAVIVAGPWLFTIFSLAGITMLSGRVVGYEELATFRVVVIYAFALSLVLSAPATIVATRCVADALWLKQPERVRSLLTGTLIAALVPVLLGAAVLVAYFRPPGDIALALAAASGTVALIWVALCFCGAIRDYAGVTWSFLVGLVVAMITTVGAAVAGLGASGMVWGFLAGLTITFFGMLRRVLATFPQAVSTPLAGLQELQRGLSTYWQLAAGALIGTAGVWADKFVFWSGEEGEVLRAGLVHAPLYDSAMFIASLVIIPALSSFVMKLETDFFERYQQYYATISGHGTLEQIETSRSRLARFTLDTLSIITVAQVGLCIILVLVAPAIVDLLALQYRQVAILQYGAIGAVFQFVFIACTSLLLFFDRRLRFLWVQCLFFALNVGLSIATLRLGEDYYGVGYFLACLISSVVAYRIADHTFETLNFLTFIGNNPSVGGGRRGRVKAWLKSLVARRDGPRASGTS